MATTGGLAEVRDELLDFVSHVLRILVAHARIAAGGSSDDVVESRVAILDGGSRAGWLFRNKAGQQFVKNDSNGKNIRWNANSPGVFENLWSGVARGAEYHAIASMFAGEAEVTDLGVGLGVEENVGGFDVPVNNPGFVSVCEALADFDDQLAGGELIDGRFVARIVKGLSLHQFHHDVGHAVGLSEVVDPDEIRVIQFCHRPGLGLELFFERVVIEFPRQEFDRHRTVERYLLGGVNRSHASGGDQRGHVVTVEEIAQLLWFRWIKRNVAHLKSGK